MKNAISDMPYLGMCAWLLKGGRLVDRVEWLIKNGFTGISFLQNIADTEEKECKDAAAAIISAGFNVTYHGNVHHRLSTDGKLDTEFIKRLIDNVIWWHENTRGVYSCCFDSMSLPAAPKNFAFDLNKEYMELLSTGLKKYGIRVGIENAPKFSNVKDIELFKKSCNNLNIGMLFDAGHANMHARTDKVQGEEEIGEYYSKLPIEVLEIHFSDNFGEKDEHKFLGYGNLDIRSLIKKVKKKPFKGQFSIEVCKDILSGQYGLDINDPEDMDNILRSKDKIMKAWIEAR